MGDESTLSQGEQLRQVGYMHHLKLFPIYESNLGLHFTIGPAEMGWGGGASAMCVCVCVCVCVHASVLASQCVPAPRQCESRSVKACAGRRRVSQYVCAAACRDASVRACVHVCVCVCVCVCTRVRAQCRVS